MNKCRNCEKEIKSGFGYCGECIDGVREDKKRGRIKMTKTKLTAYHKGHGGYIDSITSDNPKVLLNFKIDFSGCSIVEGE